MTDKTVQKLFDEYKSLVDDGYIIEVMDAEKAIIDKVYNDATKHIRTASDWKPIVNPYDFDVNELAILHNGLLGKIKADIKHADGKG